MDVLKDERRTQYDYISRYASFPEYYNTLDGKWVTGITAQMLKDISFVSYKVEQYDTLDNLALKFYGRPDYYWIIADFNNINDPFIDITEKFKTLKIPTISAVSFKE